MPCLKGLSCRLFIFLYREKIHLPKEGGSRERMELFRSTSLRPSVESEEGKVCAAGPSTYDVHKVLGYLYSLPPLCPHFTNITSQSCWSAKFFSSPLSIRTSFAKVPCFCYGAGRRPSCPLAISNARGKAVPKRSLMVEVNRS